MKTPSSSETIKAMTEARLAEIENSVALGYSGPMNGNTVRELAVEVRRLRAGIESARAEVDSIRSAAIGEYKLAGEAISILAGAVAAEREECARFVLTWVTKSGIMSIRAFKEEIAEGIRARGRA